MVKCVRASYGGHSVFVVCFFRPGMQNQSIVLDRSSLFDQNHLIRSTPLLLMYLFYFFFLFWICHIIWSPSLSFKFDFLSE